MANGPTLTHGPGATESINPGVFGVVESPVPHASGVPESTVYMIVQLDLVEDQMSLVASRSL